MSLSPMVSFLIVLVIGVLAGLIFDRVAGPNWLKRQIAGAIAEHGDQRAGRRGGSIRRFSSRRIAQARAGSRAGGRRGGRRRHPVRLANGTLKPYP